MGRNLTLWDDESATVVDRTPGDVRRTWCDPSAFADVVGVDFGSGEMHLYSIAEGRLWKVSADNARSAILDIRPGSLVVAESAHLATPRTISSLSQPFSAEELLDLYRSARAGGVTIKLFPHYHSGTRARAWSAGRFPGVHSSDKTDAADAMALALYVSTCNAVSLADPPDSFARDPKRDYGRAVRDYSTVSLNAERTTAYLGKHFPSVIDLGNSVYTKRGRLIGEKACYSIASMIVTDIDGCPFMFARNGKPPGLGLWWRYVARMTPWHHKAGIARSNLMRHAFRTFLKKFGKRNGVTFEFEKKLVPFGEHDDRQADMRTRAMKSFRDIVKDCYRKGVEEAGRRGFRMIDPVAVPFGGGTK